MASLNNIIPLFIPLLLLFRDGVDDDGDVVSCRSVIGVLQLLLRDGVDSAVDGWLL
jgi:hypothetical protein